MGSILTALKYKKPIILFPRNADFGEHRNNHQQATLRSFKDTPGVYAAFSESELLALLDNRDNLQPSTLNVSPEYEKLGCFINKIIGLK
jgi:UDP-N-acetylglucosamine transferase subunit ALG13